MSSHFIRSIFIFGAFGFGVAFWVVFRIIFARLITVSASPMEVIASIIAPVVLFALFVWFLTLTIIFVRNIHLRLLLYACVALAYIPINWRDASSIISFIGIFATLVLFDWLYREDIDNQIKPQWGRTVLTAGTLPILIFTSTISFFYFPIYQENIALSLPLANRQVLETLGSLGYFFVLQMFLVASTLLANFSVGTSMNVLMKIPAFSTLIVEKAKKVNTPMI